MTDNRGNKIKLLRQNNGWYIFGLDGKTHDGENHAVFIQSRRDALMKFAFMLGDKIRFEKHDAWSVLKEELSLAFFNHLWRTYSTKCREVPALREISAVDLLAMLHRQAREEISNPDSRYRLYGLKGGVKL